MSANAIEVISAEAEAYAMHKPVTPSPGQLLVLRLVAKGVHHKGIARQLGITNSAVNMRCYRAAQLLGTRTTTHTVVECIRLGLIEVER